MRCVCVCVCVSLSLSLCVCLCVRVFVHVRVRVAPPRACCDADVRWPPQVKLMQRNWIGRSSGAAVLFAVDGAGAADSDLQVFTTRVDTVYGVTYLAVPPRHALVARHGRHAHCIATQHNPDRWVRRVALDVRTKGGERDNTQIP